MDSIQKKIKGNSLVREYFIAGIAIFFGASYLSLLASHIASDTLRMDDAMFAFPFALALSTLFFIAFWLFIRWIFPRNTFLFPLILIGIEIFSITFLIPRFRYTPGNVSLEDWITCHPFRVIEEKTATDFAYRKTKSNVCIPRNFCRKFQPDISCKDPERWGDGYVPILNTQSENFRASRHEELSGKKIGYWIIETGNTTYFLSFKRGNGRFFAVDKNSLEYLGYDLFKDKNGFIYKNTRLLKSESSPEKIRELLGFPGNTL
jgi:hypothetical protein